jgi:hypothetical protein
MRCASKMSKIAVKVVPCNGKKARKFFLGICVVLAILMLTQVLTPIVGGSIFAVALVAFGVPSHGFRRV